MRISDWSSDVCSSDLLGSGVYVGKGIYEVATFERSLDGRVPENTLLSHDLFEGLHGRAALASDIIVYESFPTGFVRHRLLPCSRSEEHTSELQSLMRISYAVFCLKKKKNINI